MPTLPPVKRFISESGVRIYRIACQVLPRLSARVYLLLGAGAPTLIDTGSGRDASTPHILAGLESVHSDFAEPFRPGDVERIIITHTHPDHVGGLRELVDRTGADVFVHRLECRRVAACEESAVLAHRRLAGFLEQAGVDEPQREELLAAERRSMDRLCSVPVAGLLDDGDEMDGLRFLHTPGHSPGLLCTVVGDVLLCTDHILGRTVPQLWPESLDAYAGLGHYFESLEKVRRTGGLDLALAGHEPVIHNVYKRIDALRKSNHRRLDRVVEILRKADAAMTIAEITQRMYVRPQGTRVTLALCDVGARIEYLYQHGRLAIDNCEEIDSQTAKAYRYRLA